MRTIATAVVLSVCLAFQAFGQSRHDHDQQWIRQTIREKDRKALEQYYDMPVEIVRRPRTVHRERHYYDRWREARRDERHEHRHEHHRETRVYGMVMHGPQATFRDATSHVSCFPPVENTSREHSDEGRAWNDAQLGWMASVSVKYGSRFADVQNVDARTLKRQCFRSSFDESWLGRNREALAQNTNTGLGYKVRCTIIASPCMAPMTNDTPLKGDERQRLPQ